ncbi:hypothetical protein [Burkholderia ubonensis]|uniref:hypothetical protein n=1 Tax=Burkholderia ubonensis TaxID=101571 RepID=UPI000B09987E|nr:hypothetical protein [Burkholderia ubonensis]
MIDVVLANYNGEPHGGLGGRTPLEAMRFQLAKEDGLLRTLPVDRRSILYLLQEARVVTIRGNVSRGDCPHINFEHVRYGSRVLSGIAGRIGQQLRIYFNVKGIRHLHAFHMNGSELGVLTRGTPLVFHAAFHARAAGNLFVDPSAKAGDSGRQRSRWRVVCLQEGTGANPYT